MNHLYLIIIFCLCLSTLTRAQNNCEQLLAKKIAPTALTPEKIDSLKVDIRQLLNCGLDSMAFEIATSTGSFALYLISPPNKQKNHLVSYREVYDFINEMKAMPEYPVLVSIHLAGTELKRRKVNLDNWKEDSEILKKTSMESVVMNAFYDYLKSNNINGISYFEAWQNYREKRIKDSKQMTNLNPKKQYFYMNDTIGRSIDGVLKLAKKENKDVLFYFTGWANINARKLEYELFKEEGAISKINEKYLFVPLFIDAAEPISSDAQTGELDRRFATGVKSMGKKNRNVLKHYLSENGDIPSFIIVDQNGKLIRSLETGIEKASFYKFLSIMISER